MDGTVLTFVIKKLSDLLEQKVGLIAGADDEIRSLCDDLSLLTIFLGGINDQSDGTYTDLVQKLVDQLRRVSWKAEDVVDQYLLDVARHKRKKFVKRVFTGCDMLSRKGKLAAEAKDIKMTIDVILRKKESYGVRLDYGTPSDRPAQQNGESALDRRRRNVEEEDVIGFDQQFHEVMEMLLLESGVKFEELRVVSIIGMGGLGKSTLARKIFNSEEIRNHFGTKVWVVVSEHVEAKHVLKNVLQYMNVNVEKDDDDYLKEKLKERLGEMRYLIVLDDLWTPKQWEELKSYFPKDKMRRSRILLTSRIENVANVASTDSTTYRLTPLGDVDSWSLFCKKTLKGEECPSNLEDIGKRIVSKCKGLPLAIVVLGGSLSAAETKPSFRYWSKILGDTSWHPDVDNDCSKILSLSYRNLSSHLRTCFLYLGVFPEDFEIVAKELYLLWMAEGFVKPRQSRELEEDAAEQYLIDLADRNLIMISKRKSDGSIKSCRIHDLLRDLCVKEAERCNLYKVGGVGAYQNVKEGIRRLTLHKPDLGSLYQGVRTLLDFAYNDFYNLRSAWEDLSVMRVLHLHVKEGKDTAPIRTKNLVLLRYLKVYQIGKISLSKLIMTPCISNTWNLQVLNLKSNNMTILPKGIWNLKLLRHVNVRELATMPDAPSSHDSLPYLQTLSCIIYEEHTSKMLSKNRFPNLLKLDMDICLGNHLRAKSLKPLAKVLHLVALKIRFNLLETVQMFHDISGSLHGYSNEFPSTLTKIHFSYIVLTSNQWKLLGELKNLQVLKLRTAASRKNCEAERFLNQPLVFEADAFPQLIHLKLWTLHPALILEDGALRSLQYFIIHLRTTYGYPRLSALPDQLWLSTTLRQVKVIHPTKRLLKYIQSLDASNRGKVTIC